MLREYKKPKSKETKYYLDYGGGSTSLNAPKQPEPIPYNYNRKRSKEEIFRKIRRYNGLISYYIVELEDYL